MINEQSPALPSGIFLMDKPSGWTSHDAVMVLRRALGIRRIGHAGTLDPLATGLLIMLVGNAASKQAEFQQKNKIYEGVIHFGIETDTWDAEGVTVAEKPVPEDAFGRISSAIGVMKGQVLQQVPVYSAVKFKGKPLHRLAREGAAPQEPVMRNITIYGWSDIVWNAPDLSFRVECSSGTYVRSIAYALGRELGCGAHLKKLRRTRIGQYDVAGALTGEQVKIASRESLEARLIKV